MLARARGVAETLEKRPLPEGQRPSRMQRWRGASGRGPGRDAATCRTESVRRSSLPVENRSQMKFAFTAEVQAGCGLRFRVQARRLHRDRQPRGGRDSPSEDLPRRCGSGACT